MGATDELPQSVVSDICCHIRRLTYVAITCKIVIIPVAANVSWCLPFLMHFKVHSWVILFLVVPTGWFLGCFQLIC